MRKHLLRGVLWLALIAVAALPSYAQTRQATQSQYPTSGWDAYAPARVQCGELRQADFNSTADQPIPISVPSVTFMVDSIAVANASISLTTAGGGFYTAPAKGGVAVVAGGQAYLALTGAAVGASGSAMSATIATAGQNTALNLSTLYFSLSVAQGAPATADIRVYCRPLYG